MNKELAELIKLTVRLLKRLFESGAELPSPKTRLKSGDVFHDKGADFIIIKNVPDKAWITTVQDTNSMEPLIDIGDIVFLYPVINGLCQPDNDELIVGDIVVYNIGSGQNIIHRIVRIFMRDGVRTYKCKGDNLYAEDPFNIIDRDIKYVYRGQVN